MTGRSRRPGISRRGFVTGALGAGAAVGAGAALAGCSREEEQPAAPQPPGSCRSRERTSRGSPTLPIPEQGLIASFNVHSPDRAGLKATLQELTEEIRGLMAGKPPETRDPAYPPVDSGILGEKPPADNLSDRGRRRGVVVRRPVRAGRSQAQGTGDDAVPGQRPAGPQAVPRGHLDHLRGRSQRHRSVRAAPDHAPYPKRPGAAVDDRRLRPRHRCRPGLGGGHSSKPVGVQGRNGEPRRRRWRADGSPRLGAAPRTANPRGRSAVRIRPSASSGCSSSSGTAPGSPSRRR